MSEDLSTYVPISTTFEEGQLVTFRRSIWTGMLGEPNYRNLKGSSYVVKEIKDVPPEEIEYNKFTHEGGVGHHQWLIIEVDDELRMYSGGWFCNDPLDPPTDDTVTGT